MRDQGKWLSAEDIAAINAKLEAIEQAQRTIQESYDGLQALYDHVERKNEEQRALIRKLLPYAVNMNTHFQLSCVACRCRIDLADDRTHHAADCWYAAALKEYGEAK